MATLAANGRPPYFHPASPASNSALQHCSTTEIQLASTSISGVEDCANEGGSPFAASRSTILPALINNTSMSMLNGEDYVGSLFEYANTVNTHDPATHSISTKDFDDVGQSSDATGPEFVGSAARIRAFGLAKRLSGRSRSELSSDASRRSGSTSTTQIINERDYGSRTTPSLSTPINFTQKTVLKTSFLAASPLPDLRSIITPIEPLPSGTPVSKQLIAARGIMKDPNTPGSGQSVRFFSRDTYQTSSVADHVSRETRGNHSASSPAADVLLSNPDISQDLLVDSHTSISPESNSRQSMRLSKEPSSFEQQTVATRDNSASSPPEPTSTSNESQMVHQSTPEKLHQQERPRHHLNCTTQAEVSRKSDVFGDALAVVSHSTKPTFFASSTQSPSSTCGPQKVFATHNTSGEHTSAHSILGNSTRGNITMYPPGAYNSKASVQERASDNSFACRGPSAVIQSQTANVPSGPELIVLDDSSDLSSSCDNFHDSSALLKVDETVYVTPESSRRRFTRSGPSQTSHTSHLSHDSLSSQVLEEEVVEDVFAAHRRELAAIRKDRDGWKNLCTSLMEVTEASFAPDTCNAAPHLREDRDTDAESGSLQGEAKESPETASTIGSSTIPRETTYATSKLIDDPAARLRDDLWDMQIRLESKQKECEQERSRADRFEVQLESQQAVMTQMRQENDILVRDTRDADVKLELHARERESKVRQQLAEQIQHISAALEEAQQHNEHLLLTTQQQQDDIQTLKSNLEDQQRDLEQQSHIARELEVQKGLHVKLLHELQSEKDRTHGLETTLEDRQETIHQLELQLDQERQARIKVETSDELESLHEVLAKETQRNIELSSIITDQEEVIQDLKAEIDQQQSNQKRELITRDERIKELESAYHEQVQENREQYLQLEGAIEEREAKYAERLGELEVISDDQEREIQRLQAKIETLQGELITEARNTEDLQRLEIELNEREEYIQKLTQTITERSQKIKQYEASLTDLKRQAADDVFESTKRERRIEKLLDDREMLNIAVEQLQIQIQLVSTSQ
ncbi:hypothetical protein QFC19_006825 [Naganishia cerealis]|uniref:Uncharacterized protein n=1 Tax=Naganishia cerealis TaxID=610337 RepID=A0ACC2VDG5_9TREE|nr:hypothetical protein QFC19_006825 [Naganishia cerealis]